MSLLVSLLVAPVARAEPPPDDPASDAPTRDSARAEAGTGGGGFTTQKREPDLGPQRPRGWRPVTQKPQTPLDAPVSPGAWAVYGSLTALPLGGVYGASRLGGERLWVTAAETVAGGVLGSLPGSLLFLQPPEAGGRWTEPDVAAFGAGLVLTPPMAALGTWGLGELAFGGSQERGRAFLGALGGAAAGTLLGVAMHGLMEEVVGNRETLQGFRKYVTLGFIGSGATLGYQWAGGGARPRGR
ncbi:hypothetical protein [Melittangium boletus]|uniref:hypothetical protein n=1 Tax=Melittangium boletus TaxID=83453 RepID=UPI001FE609C6|nr:hypothetical protein [Melittangium boletus]